MSWQRRIRRAQHCHVNDHGNQAQQPLRARRAAKRRSLATIIDIVLRQISLLGQQLLGDEPPHCFCSSFQTSLPTVQSLEFHHAAAFNNLCLTGLYEFDASAQCSSCSNQIIDQHHLVTLDNGALLHTHFIQALVLLRVGAARDRVWQFPSLSKHDKGNAKLDRHGREEKATSLEAADLGNPHFSEALRPDCAHGIQQLRVLQQALDVIKPLQLLERVVRDVQGNFFCQRPVRLHVVRLQSFGSWLWLFLGRWFCFRLFCSFCWCRIFANHLC
mmetsp:Transcript_49275/g.110549  ORF Transcript_49275/g.110549 Transcript_49275/m.110549 type:complete len:273 (+) Transcript_49275:2-820(+)